MFHRQEPKKKIFFLNPAPPSSHLTSPTHVHGKHGQGGHIHVADLPSPIWSIDNNVKIDEDIKIDANLK